MFLRKKKTKYVSSMKTPYLLYNKCLTILSAQLVVVLIITIYCSCDIAANSLIHSSKIMAHRANSFVRILCNEMGDDVMLKLSSDDSLKSFNGVSTGVTDVSRN